MTRELTAFELEVMDYLAGETYVRPAATQEDLEGLVDAGVIEPDDEGYILTDAGLALLDRLRESAG